MNNISWFNFTTLVAGIFSLEFRSRLGFFVELQFWDAVSVTEAPPLPGGTALVSNVGLQQTLEYIKKLLYFKKFRLVATNQMCWSDSLVTICYRSLRSSSTSYLSVLTVWYVVWYCIPRIRLIHMGATDVCIWAPWSYFEFIFEKGLVLCQHWLCVVRSVGLRVVPKIIEYMY